MEHTPATGTGRRRPWISAALASGMTAGLLFSGQAQAHETQDKQYEQDEQGEQDEYYKQHKGGGGYVNPGILMSPVLGRSPAVAAGGEVSFLHSPRWLPAVCHCGVGAFGQVQRYFSAGGAHTRVAAGVQAGGLFGVELGLAHRTANDEFSSTTGLHVAPYVSVGVVSLALRFTMPIHEDVPRRGHGFETALAVGVKIPIPYGDKAESD